MTMMIFKKALPRRAFLQGAGAALALPLLDAMAPALEAADEPAGRLCFVYVPNGRIMSEWTPSEEGTSFRLPTLLEPLAPFRSHFRVLSGLCQNSARELPGEGDQGGMHERAGGTFLTGVHPKKTDGADFQAGVSIDQIAARELGNQTQLASLEIGIDSAGIVGACEKGWSCSYINTLSWRTPSTPLPMESNPRRVFERMFGDTDTTDPAEHIARIRMNRSLLDSISESGVRLLGELGSGDRGKVSDYLDAVRDIERRIDRAEEQGARELPSLERPSGVPSTFEEHVKLMFDLQVLAFQTDLTRVITFMMGREKTDRPYPEIGIPDAHHPLTHHGNNPEKIAKVVQIEAHQSRMFAYYMDKLQSTPDGEGSLLDHMMIVYGGGISNGNIHSYDDLPIILAGGAGGQISGGVHHRYADGTPMANLYLTLLDKLGVGVENFGDSTGRLELLPV
jgi:hypothetical protein